MKRFLSFLACGALLAGFATASHAQVNIDQVKIGTGNGNYLSLMSGGAAGSWNLTIPDPGGNVNLILSNVLTGPQVISSALTVNGAFLVGGAGSFSANTVNIGTNGVSGVPGQLNILDGGNTGTTGGITWSSGQFQLSGGLSIPASSTLNVSDIEDAPAGMTINTGAGNGITHIGNGGGGVRMPAKVGIGQAPGADALAVTGTTTLTGTLDVTGILTAATGASGIVFGTGVNATTLTSTASTAQAISFPDNSGTLALLTDITNAISGTANRIPKFITANTIGNSKLNDNGANLTYNGNFTVSTAGAVSNVTTLGASSTITGSSFSGAGTGLTGTATSLSIGGNAATATTASTVTTDANLTGPVTSVGNATSITPGGHNTFLNTDGTGAVNWAGLSIGVSLQGTGTTGVGSSALAINLTNPNTWTAQQTFADAAANAAAARFFNTFVNGAAGNAIGATVASAGAGAGTNTGIVINAQNSSGANQGITFTVNGGSGTHTDIVGTSSSWSVTSAGAATFGGDVSTANHIVTTSSIGSVAKAGDASGTPTAVGSDVAGTVTIPYTGTVAAGGSVTVSFASNYSSAPVVVIAPASSGIDDPAVTKWYVSSAAGTFTINFNDGGAGDNGTLTFTYIVVH